MGLFRVRATSFLAGFGLAAGLGLYQLRQDIISSHEVLSRQVSDFQRNPHACIRCTSVLQAQEYVSKLEKRVVALESVMASQKEQPQQ